MRTVVFVRGTAPFYSAARAGRAHTWRNARLPMFEMSTVVLDSASSCSCALSSRVCTAVN